MGDAIFIHNFNTSPRHREAEVRAIMIWYY